MGRNIEMSKESWSDQGNDQGGVQMSPESWMNAMLQEQSGSDDWTDFNHQYNTGKTLQASMP
jgi:hypothetical protein